MRCFYLLSSALVAYSAYAGPYDVPGYAEPDGELKPYHQLKMPEPKKEAEPLPEPDIYNAPIESGEISISDGDSLLAHQGILVPKAHKYRESAWQYMTQAEATALLSNLPEKIKIKLLKDRIISLLLLRAQPPQEADDRWLTIRLAGLEKLEAGDKAATLLQSIPPSLRQEMNPLALFQFFATSGRVELACEAIRGAPKPEAVDDDQWKRVELYCLSALGEFAKVELELALAEEAQASYPSWFIRLLEQFQYPDLSLPQAEEADTALDRVMIEAAKEKPLPLGEPELTYPKSPSYAIKAIAHLVRENKLEETHDWLDMLDRGESESASSYVAHELIRFLQTDPNQPRSIAAETLPPFTALQDASGSEIDLLTRFYHVMQVFDYRLPEPTLAWLGNHAHSLKAKAGMKQAAAQLSAKVIRGDKAGYMLGLAAFIDQFPVKTLPNATLETMLYDLQRIDEVPLAKKIAAEAVLAAFE